MAMVKCKECGKEVSDQAKSCPSCGAKPPKKLSIGKLLFVALIGFGAFKFASMTTAVSERVSDENARKNNALNNVKLDFSWKKEGLGAVMEADFTIANDNDFQIKDIDIKCTHYGKSGTQIDSNDRTIYEVIPPKSKKAFHNFNMGLIHSQASESSCKIVNIAI